MARSNPATSTRWTSAPPRIAACLAALAAVALAGTAAAAANEQSAPGGDALRVCSDPDNMPLSNRRGEGYENRIAEELARDLGRRVEYTYFPQRMGFVRHTLRARDEVTHEYKCDVIIGVPKGYELTATTRPYMRSTYALVFESREDLAGLRTADDLLKLPQEKQRALRIGLFGRSPGADWLLRNGLFDRAVVYPAQSGDPAEHPALTIARDLGAGKIDAAIVWGPIAGFLVQQHSGSQVWRAVPFRPDPQIKFDYEISMGVRRGEDAWKQTLDAWIAENQDRINEILASFRVPLVDEDGSVSATRPASEPARRADGTPQRTPLRLDRG